MALLAVDVGGTKIAVALVTGDGCILDKCQEPTAQGSPAAAVEQIAVLSQRIASLANMDCVGVAVPAALADVETDRVLWAPNLAGWRDISLREMLSERLGIPVFLEYDGHAAVLGEWWVGAGKGYRTVASIVIGTGIGGGFIVEGRLLAGRNRLAGALGWMPQAGPDGIDHWENLAAGPAIARHAEQLLARGASSVLQAGNLTARDVFDAARGGDTLALQVVDEAAEWIGRGVASVVSLVNPEVVVLGGSVGRQGDLLLPIIRAAVRRWAQPISAEALPIVSSVLGEEANLLGAAYSALLRLGTKGEDYVRQ